MEGEEDQEIIYILFILMKKLKEFNILEKEEDRVNKMIEIYQHVLINLNLFQEEEMKCLCSIVKKARETLNDSSLRGYERLMDTCRNVLEKIQIEGQ